jgi:hypothetical protein
LSSFEDAEREEIVYQEFIFVTRLARKESIFIVFYVNILGQCFSTWVPRNLKVPPKYFWVPPNI